MFWSNVEIMELMDEETVATQKIRRHSRDSEEMLIDIHPWCPSTRERVDRSDLIQANSRPEVPDINIMPLANFIPSIYNVCHCLSKTPPYTSLPHHIS